MAGINRAFNPRRASPTSIGLDQATLHSTKGAETVTIKHHESQQGNTNAKQ
ncbi:hypothetical protein POX_b03200 [Penicillium oxalicum]|uniref:hypothetical protein n=1 Tax=Penicillium oxalicum TaxID=69781 RepID=UPI0020B6A4DE|nr:hypothetical protein POX_b03200 [Penicillium oxalicum]KAI2793150.1 hypothetical protein POX_b03200 [Penicillium oxalicum]